MANSIPERADIRQLRIQAKELLRELQSGALSEEGVTPDRAKLSDAQRILARRYGYSSWPKLVEEIETPQLLEAFKNAFHSQDLSALERLLRTKPNLRKRINDSMFAFDSPPIVVAGRQPNAKALIPLLVRYGADPNVRSKWWAGGFSALDGASKETADLLCELGARYDVWSAAKHGQMEELQKILQADPSMVNAPGGDGMTPLHFAGTPEVAEFLLANGAELEIRDVDHESTPIQHQINQSEIVRILLRHGARPDIFTAVSIDDAALAQELLGQDPSQAEARVGEGEFVTRRSNGGHTYEFQLGPRVTPQALAAQRGSHHALSVLLKYSSPVRRLLSAAWQEDAEAVRALVAEGHDFSVESAAVADAAQQGRARVVRLLLEAGLDPCAPGMDSGSALHVACWFGYPEVVQELVDRVPLDLLDAHHGSPPLGWATHGAHWSHNPAGDHVAVVELLLAHGADPKAAANSLGHTMLQQAGAREDVKAVLRVAVER